MKHLLTASVLAMSIASGSAYSGVINGDFSSCDLSGWNQDTDGWGNVSLGNDFAVDSNGSGCVAQINVDYFDITGDILSDPISEAFFANTLYQDIDLTVGSGYGLALSFDWNFYGEESAGDPANDFWFAGLGDGFGSYYGADGEIGYLYEGFGYGSGSLNVNLDSSFFNQDGWTIEFQLLPGVDDFFFEPNALGSTLEIDNVQLTAFQLPSTSVPEPASALLLSLGLAGLYSRKKRKI